MDVSASAIGEAGMAGVVGAVGLTGKGRFRGVSIDASLGISLCAGTAPLAISSVDLGS